MLPRAPASRAFLTVLWTGTAGLVVTYRILLPIWRSAFHQLRVAWRAREAPLLLEGGKSVSTVGFLALASV